MGFSGAWKVGAYRQPTIASPRDPHHSQPETGAGPQNWAQESGRAAPDALVTESTQAYALDHAAGGNPVSIAPHDQGVGYGAGLSWASAQAQADAAHLKDDGSLLQRKWSAPTERDGTYHVERYQWAPDDVPGGGLYPAGMPDLPPSPGMWQGLNRAQYPNRRVGHRITRWMDRSYARRDWGVEFRPVVVPNAYTPPAQPAVSGRNQYSSPFGAAQNTQTRIVTLIAPQTRRVPGAWDQSIRQDGTASSPYTADDAGFQSWSL